MPRSARVTLPVPDAVDLAKKGLLQSLNPQQIRSLRDTAGLRQIEVARRMNWHHDTVRAWERPVWDKGHRAMSRQVRVAFCTLILGMLADPYADAADVPLRRAA